MIEKLQDDGGLGDDALRFLEERVSAAASYIRSLESAVSDAANPRPAPSPSGVPPPSAEDRYVFEAELASGGTGRILHAFDRSMQRLVAVKVLREDMRTERNVERLLEEARATGQLEHPNIPPVYDLGGHPQHGSYFTMRLIRGRALGEILRDCSIGRLETLKRFSLTRLIQILEQVAMGVHYAHIRGVIHRDLKPGNIMVGDFGEVLVMDWGIAKVSHGRVDSTVLESSGNGKVSDLDTGARIVSGTLSYMAPEQARGWTEEIDARTDVFGLGAILYEILTYHPPYEGSRFDEVHSRACAGDIVPPSARAPRRAIPASLEAICLKALSPSKEDRYPDAMTFHEDLQVFLDGTLEAERRRREAAHLELEGKQKAREYLRLTEAEEELRRQAREQLESFAPHDPVSLKAGAWSLFERAGDMSERRIRAFSEATAALHSALHIDEECSGARETLAELYWKRFEEAEATGKREEMAIYRGLVERYDTGRFRVVLQDVGHLTLVSNPPGARVTLHRVEDRGWRLAEGEGRVQGETPLKLDLPIGHYLLVLGKEGYRETRAPVVVARSEKQLVRVNLYPSEVLGEGFVLVPQGEFIIGGDPEAPGSLPHAKRYLPDYFVARYPVTFREYCAFLDDLRERGDPDLERWIPRTEKEGECVRIGPGGRYEPSKKALDIDAATLSRHDASCEWRLPIIGVSWYAAERYAAWLSEKTGRRMRLLKDAEWEKAARGASGAVFPWGSRFDWSLVKGGLSRPERAQIEPTGAFPTDCSIYGIGDLAGSVREWCASWFLEGRYRLTRGGAWAMNHEGAFRAAQRSGLNPEIRSAVVGFRIAADPPSRRRG